MFYLIRYLHGFEEFHRKLGCTMNSPRDRIKSRGRPGRSLIRDRDRAASGSSTPRCDVEEEEKVVKVEEVPTEPTPAAAVVATVEAPPVAAAPVVAAPVAVAPAEEQNVAEEEEADESSSSASLPTRKPRERSIPLRLLDAAKPPVLPSVKKEVAEESGGEDNEQAENESNSSQSVRSQRGTRNRVSKEKPADDDAPEVNRPARKRGKSKPEGKDEDEKVRQFWLCKT